MNKWITFCSLLLGVPVYASIDTSVTNSGNDNALLWEVSGNGLATPSFLFGTIHLICEADYFWTDAMQQALSQCQQVAFELDMDDAALQTQISNGLMLKDGQRLQDFFTEEQYEQLTTNLMEYAALPINMMESMKPFAVLSFLSLKAINCPIPQSYEAKIVVIAQQQNKTIIGLEAAADQIAILDNLQSDTLADMLLIYSSKIDLLKLQYQELLAAYKSQDIKTIYQLIENSPDYSIDLDHLLHERNKKWVVHLAAIMPQQSTFVAVGAGHLAGEQGVIALLRKKGFILTPVK